jgi:hypothetical protein
MTPLHRSTAHRAAIPAKTVAYAERVFRSNKLPVAGFCRRTLYLAALSAQSCNKDMRTFYQRLIANGKSAKTALLAVARKLATLANTLITQDRFWQPQALQNA